ncbi:MAG: tetratricopeptide repeat protein [Desulfosalsimonadaceae bacterium]
MNQNISSITPVKKTYQHVVVCLLLIAATLIVYRNVRTYEFISFDDNLYVLKNPHVQQGLTLDSLLWAFNLSKDAENQSYWHPLTWISHMMDCRLFGLNAGKHHLVNLIIHIINVLLLFMVFHQMTGAIWKSAFVAALFAVHPLNVDSVAWIAERKNLLSTMFWLLTMMAWVRYARRPSLYRYLVVFAGMTAGLLAKPMLVTLPCVLLLMDFWPLNRLKVFSDKSPALGIFRQASPVRLIVEKIPLLVLSVLSMLLSVIALHNQNQIVSAHFIPISLRIENAIISYVRYIVKIIWPQDMAIYYPFPDSIPLWQVSSSLILLTAAFAIVLFLHKKAPYLAVGWLWFIGTLTPVTGIIQGGLWPAIADRWTYVPAIGIFIIISWGGAALLSKVSKKPVLRAITPFIILTILIISSRNQVSYWENSITLFSHALDVTEHNDIAHYNLGVALGEKGNMDQAIFHYYEGLKINPNMTEGHNNLGNALIKKGMLDQAISHFNQALQLNPKLAQAHTNLGNALARKGKLDEALYHYESIISESQPDSVTVKNRDALLSLLKPANRIDILFKAAMRFAGEKKYDRAVTLLRKGLEINPDQPNIYYNISCLYALQNRNEPAINWLQQAVDHGYDNWAKLKTDPDMNNIKDEPVYRRLTEEEGEN